VRPRLLDLFCGAGGAAVGYHRAGFDVVGVDINPQPRYPFEFHQADAMTFPLDGFDAIHASPPCQAYSHGTPPDKRSNHPDLLDATRDRLNAAGLPWVIENVPRAPLRSPVILCGSQFDLTAHDPATGLRTRPSSPLAPARASSPAERDASVVSTAEPAGTAPRLARSATAGTPQPLRCSESSWESTG
jgi:hypothetical protein